LIASCSSTACSSAQLALLAHEGRDQRHRDASYLERLTQLRDLIVGRLDELEAAGAARLRVEKRYLAGHPALSRRPCRPDAEVVSARTDQLVADLVEPAKVTALEKLGDGQHAMVIAAGWVRGKLTASASKVSAR
jgi:hypothetical protein